MASLGYWAGERYAGKGYTTAAVRAVVRHAFEDLELHRVEAACQPDNFASRRVLEKAGFIQEGAARAYLKINGDWRDHLLFGIVNDAR
jgi:ribosomal-protein-alanine N-acetyltransferase